jgi:hypothetical protein
VPEIISWSPSRSTSSVLKKSSAAPSTPINID